jgi:hypothetical protein
LCLATAAPDQKIADTMNTMPATITTQAATWYSRLDGAAYAGAGTVSAGLGEGSGISVIF